MTLPRLLRRWFGVKADDLPYPCDECGRNVPPFQGVRDLSFVWCGEECAGIGWERTAI